MSELSLYASARPTVPSSAWTIAPQSGGLTTAGGTLNFVLQARTTAGLNLPGSPKSVTWTAGQRVRVTIDPTARATGEDIHAFVLSAYTSDPAAAIQLAEWRAREPNGANRTLPATIDLTRDSHLSLNFTVSTLGSLPANPVHGTIRQIPPLFYKYDSEASSGEVASGSGYWVRTDTNSTYLTDTTGERGCDRSVTLLTADDILPAPEYAGDGSDSAGIVYWLLNGLDELGDPIPVGSLVALQVRVNDSPAFGLALSGKIKARVLGSVRRSTGALDTTYPLTNQIFIWEPESPLFPLPLALPSGHALAIEIVFAFRSLELFSAIENDSVVLQVVPFIRGKFGTFEASWYLTGDCVTSEGDRLRCVPALLGIRRLAGTCLIKQYLASPATPETFGYNLLPDTADQKICINAALGGSIILRGPSEPLTPSEGIRAKFSTASGERLSSWSSTVTLANQGLTVTIPHPCDGDGNGTVRSDYPDVIASNNEGQFNLPQIRLYLQIGSTIYRQNAPVTAIVAPSQSVTISSLTGFTSIGSLPANPTDPYFDLWAIAPPTLATTTGTLTGSARVLVAHVYPTGNTRVTAIDHSAGIPEIGLTLAEAIARTDYWGAPVSGRSALRAIPSASATDGETRVVILSVSPFRVPYTFTLSLPAADDGDRYLACDDNPARGWIKLAGSVDGTGTGTAGINAFTSTTANFTVPAIDSTVTVAAANTSWMVVGQPVFVEGSGLYRVAAIANTNSVTLTNLAGTGTSVNAGAKISPSGERGSPGAAAYTVTTASFTVPAVNSSVSIALGSTAWAIVNVPIFIQGAGHYLVTAIDNATILSATNLGYSGNALVGESIASGARVAPTGPKGVDGNGIGDMLASEYDTDGDLKVDAAEVADSIAGNPAGDNVYGIKDGVKGWQGFPAWVREIPLFGLVAGSDTPISSSNTIIQAFQNLQAQISAILSGGRLIPPGGTAGQVLKKSTNGDYAVGWGDDNAGSGGSSNFTGLADTFSSFTGRASQFLRVNSAGTLIESIALGAAAFLKPGTDPGDLLQRDVDGRYPAGDGRNITALNASNIATGTVPTARLDTGTTAGKVVVLDGAGRLPAIDGSQLTNLPGGTSQSLIVPVRIEAIVIPVSLNFVSNGDQNDLFYYLGTNENTGSWSNPSPSKVTITHRFGNNTPTSTNLLTNRSASTGELAGGGTIEILIDLGSSFFRCNRYVFYYENIFGSSIFTFSGSGNNTTWTNLSSFSSGSVSSWLNSGIFTNTVPYRYYRLIATNTSGGGWTIPEIQLYGEYTPPTLSVIDVSPSWVNKLAFNDLYSNNFTLRIPDTTTGFSSGSIVDVVNDNNCTITVSPQNSNVTLISPNTNTLEQNRMGRLIHRGSKRWHFQKY